MKMDLKEERVGNLIILGASYILVTIAFIGFSVSLRIPKHLPNDDVSPPTPPPKSSQKSLEADSMPVSLETICSMTDYVPTCTSSLHPVSEQSNATIQDYIKASIHVTIQEMEGVLNLSRLLASSRGTGKENQGLNDCNELLASGLDALGKARFVASNSSDLLKERSADVKSWLSAAISFQQACYDGLKEYSIRAEFDYALLKPMKMASNALAIVNSSFEAESPFNKAPLARRLLHAYAFQNDYPKWFPAADRKLLEMNSEGGLKPDAVVAADGTGQFKTIGEALNAYKLNSNWRYVIYVKAGEYNEIVRVTMDQVNVYMYGDGHDQTIVTGSRHTDQGFTSYQTATFAVLGNGFVCKSMTFQNKATSGKEAVALRVQADKVAFFNCKIEGSHGTLYALAHRQFYRECVISGNMDFIFGDSSTVLQKSQILVRKPPETQKFNCITAQGKTERSEVTGFVLQGCTIKKDQESANENFGIRTYLGRPWKRHSRTVIMQSDIGDVIDKVGWTMGLSNLSQDNVFYAEYQNKGPGADTTDRVKWKGYRVISDLFEALKYSTKYFIQGNFWLNETGLPFEPELL